MPAATSKTASGAVSVAIESASIGGPQLSALFFLMQSTPSHQVTGTLLGFFEEDSVKTDHDTDAVTRRVVITGMKQDHPQNVVGVVTPKKGGNGEEDCSSATTTTIAPPPKRSAFDSETTRSRYPTVGSAECGGGGNQHAALGVFTLRRRTGHRLSFKDTQFLNSEAGEGEQKTGGRGGHQPEQQLLLLVTESETETGLVGTHYTMYARTLSSSSPKRFFEIPLHVSNLVSTGGDYQNLLRSFTRCPPLSAGLEAVAARQSAAMEESSTAMTKAVTDSVQAAISELQRVTERGKNMWTQVQDNSEALTQKKKKIAELKLAIEKKKAAATSSRATTEVRKTSDIAADGAGSVDLDAADRKVVATAGGTTSSLPSSVLPTASNESSSEKQGTVATFSLLD